MTPRDPRLVQADRYTQMADHYLAEMEKLKRWRDNRLATLRRQGERAVATRPTTIHDAESVAWSLSQTDPKLTEYGGGLTIVERRAAMYASMATDLRLQVLTDLLSNPRS